uniref:RUN domain-containing protein n=1 Tax=Mesocestoides corti TaxID=53468 RepID=A0A5K3F4X4_MESCO
MLDHLAAANPVSLCDPMACGKDKQPTTEGLGWEAPDAWLWLLIGQKSLFCCTSLLPIRVRVFYIGGSGCVRITQIEPQP